MLSSTQSRHGRPTDVADYDKQTCRQQRSTTMVLSLYRMVQNVKPTGIIN